MHKGTLILVLSLIMLLACTPTSAVRASQIVEREGYVKIETKKAIYFVNQALIDSYGQATFSRLFRLVDERFDEIMNITGWSSERFYGNKLEVTVEKSGDVGASGSGGFGKAYVLLGKDFVSTNETANSVEGFPSWTIGSFLHEMTHGITPSSLVNRKWLVEGFGCFLAFEVQVMYGDRTRGEVEAWYEKDWEHYVNNGYMDFRHNKTIQDDGGYFITAWMLDNISKTYGWASHERFFSLLPDEFLLYMPSFPSLSINESSSYNYYLDSLIVSYYSQAAGANLIGLFKSWGVETLPNPMTVVCVNGTRGSNSTFTSEVVVSLSAFGESDIIQIKYSSDQKTWSIYVTPFSVSDDMTLYCRSTDRSGNTGVTASIPLRVEINNPKTEPFPIVLFAGVSMVAVVVAVAAVVYVKKRKRLVALFL